MRESGRRTKPQEKADTCIPMDQCTKAIGSMTSKMALARRSGQMDLLTKANIGMGSSMDRVLSHGRMGQTTQVNS